MTKYVLLHDLGQYKAGDSIPESLGKKLVGEYFSQPIVAVKDEPSDVPEPVVVAEKKEVPKPEPVVQKKPETKKKK